MTNHPTIRTIPIDVASGKVIVRIPKMINRIDSTSEIRDTLFNLHCPVQDGSNFLPDLFSFRWCDSAVSKTPLLRGSWKYPFIFSREGSNEGLVRLDSPAIVSALPGSLSWVVAFHNFSDLCGIRSEIVLVRRFRCS